MMGGDGEEDSPEGRVDKPPGPGPGQPHYSEYDLDLGFEADTAKNNVWTPQYVTPVQMTDRMSPQVHGLDYHQEQSSSFTQTFLRGILTSLDSRDPVVANAWLETLLDAIDLLPIEVIKQEIITIAINKSQMSQPPFSRMASCKILGKLSTKLDQLGVRQEVLPPTLSLCQDVESEVRNCMCRQLAFVARGVGLELTKSAVLPVLVELSNDESCDVRLSAIETVVHLLSLLDDEVCNNTIVPLVIKSCEQAKTLDDSSLPVIARHLGRLCHGLTPNLSPEQKNWFLGFYQELARLGTTGSNETSHPTRPMPDLVPKTIDDKCEKYVECRQACAFNLPGMVLFVGAANFTEKLLQTFCDFVSDPSPYVRKTLASGLHELIKIIGVKFSSTKLQIVTLFNDSNVDVLSSMVTNMVYVIDALARFGVLQFGSTGSYSQELSLGILNMEEMINSTRNWRLHADCLEKLSCLANCISATVIQTRYIPLLFLRAAKSRPLPSRVAAVRTVLVILRFTVKQEDRSSIMSRIKEELAHGRSCHSRLLYLKMCEMALMLFSRQYFKLHFFNQFLALHRDPVPNVRLRVVSLLPQLKSLISLPSDNSLLQYLEEVVKHLLMVEKDRDVLNSLQSSINSLSDIEPGMDGVEFPQVEEDRDDDRKLREEKLIANMEEQIKQVQGTKFDQLITPSSIPSRLRSLGLDRKRSESLPPALSRGETQLKTRFNSPEPPRYSNLEKQYSKPFSPELQRRAIWTSQDDPTEEEYAPRPSLNTPYSSSLENLDPNTQEFMIDAGIKLPTSVGNMSSAASLPNLTSIGRATEPLVRSNSIPDTQSLDGELSKYLISNKEMEQYEAEYIKAAQEVSETTSDSELGPKLRGRSDTRLRPPSFTSALTTTPSKLGGENADPKVSSLQSEHDKQENTKMHTSVSNKSTQSRVSPPKEERERTQKWNNGSIERLAEKWASKRDTLIKETGGMTETLQQRKLAMEQKLESVKRSIPKRTLGFTPESVHKRLSLCEKADERENNVNLKGKRKSLDVDIVLPPTSSDSDEDDPRISMKLGEIRNQVSPSPRRNRASVSPAKHRISPVPDLKQINMSLTRNLSPSPGLDRSRMSPSPVRLYQSPERTMSSPVLRRSDLSPGRKPSPELGSSDSDDSLPPYPSIDKPKIDQSKPLPPPPPSLDSLFNIPELETPTIVSSASSKLSLMGSASCRMVTAPRTSVAVSRSIPAPQRSIANSLLLPIKSTPELSKVKTENECENEFSTTNRMDKVDSKFNPALKSSLQYHPSSSTSFGSHLANQNNRMTLGQKVQTKKFPGSNFSIEQRKSDINTSHLSKLAFIQQKPEPGSETTQLMTKQASQISLPAPTKQSRAENTPAVEKPNKSVVYIGGRSKDREERMITKTRELKPPQSLLTTSFKRSPSPGGLGLQRTPGSTAFKKGSFGTKRLSQENLLDLNRNEEQREPTVKPREEKKISQSQESSSESSRSSSPPGQDSVLTPDSLESFSPAGTPQSPGSSGRMSRTGIVGPRRSSGMRMWQGQLGSRKGDKTSPNISRSPSPSQISQTPTRKTETLPRTNNSSKTLNSPSQVQRRSYGGSITAPGGKYTSAPEAKYSSAPCTPRHSRNDLRGGGSSPSSPGVSRSTSPAISAELRRRSTHYPVSTQYEMKITPPPPARTVSERSLLTSTPLRSFQPQPQSRTQSHSALQDLDQIRKPSYSNLSPGMPSDSRGFSQPTLRLRSNLQAPNRKASPSSTPGIREFTSCQPEPTSSKIMLQPQPSPRKIAPNSELSRIQVSSPSQSRTQIDSQPAPIRNQSSSLSTPSRTQPIPQPSPFRFQNNPPPALRRDPQSPPTRIQLNPSPAPSKIQTTPQPTSRIQPSPIRQTFTTPRSATPQIKHPAEVSNLKSPSQILLRPGESSKPKPRSGESVLPGSRSGAKPSRFGFGFSSKQQ